MFLVVAHTAYLAGMCGLGLAAGLGPAYFAGWIGAALCAGRQIALVRARDRKRCFRAFNNNSLLGFLLFAGLALDMLFNAG